METFYTKARKCEVSGYQLNYFRQGKGDTIVFVHGITTYSFIWRKIIPFFIRDYDVIAIDLLGCGDSDIPLKEDFSLKHQSELLKKFADILDLKKIHLIGHDVGGGVAQIFAVNYPKLLYDLILINSVAYNFWPVQPIVAMRTPIIRKIAMASLDIGILKLIVKRGLYHEKNLTDELMTLFWKPMKDSLKRKGFLHFAKCLDNKNLTDIEEDLRKLNLPVLIIRGEKDIYLSASIARELNEEIPKSKLIKIETAGHFIQEDEPEQVAKSILKFFNR